MDNFKNIHKTTDQQIDEAVESLKAILIQQAQSPEQTEEIRRRLDSIGHEVKALNSFVNEMSINKATIHKIQSLMP